MKGIELLKIMGDLNKPFFTIADLEKMTRLSRPSLYVALKRWADKGILERVAPGMYSPMMSDLSIEKIAAQIYIPNYLSFESALARQGILEPDSPFPDLRHDAKNQAIHPAKPGRGVSTNIPDVIFWI